MKKRFVCLCCLLLLSGMNVQQTSHANGKNLRNRELGYSYREKKMQQCSVAWILLGAGSARLAVGTNIYTSDHRVSSNGTNSSNGGLMIIGGAVLSVISIPFLFQPPEMQAVQKCWCETKKHCRISPNADKYHCQLSFPCENKNLHNGQAEVP